MRELSYFFLIILLCSISTGCKKDKTKDDQHGEVVINSDGTELSGRVSTSDAGVIFIDPDGIANKKTTADTSTNEYPLELVASVSAPIHQGDTLRATHVEINGNYAYISYNMEGAKYKGAIDVFNISAAITPQLVTSVIFPTIDISAIAYLDNKLFIAGAKDVNSSSSATSPAIVGYLQLQNGVPTSTFQSAHLPSFAGTGVIASDNKVYVTTGTTGGVYVINPANLQTTGSTTLSDARSVAANSTYYAVLTGSNGVNIYNKSGNGLVKNISLGTDLAEAKRTMDFNSEYLVIANGKGGIKYYNVNSGSKTGEITLPTSLPGVLNNDDIVTNAVSYNNQLIFAANGAAGTYVCTENTNNHSLKLVGAFGFGIGNSINYVKSKDNFLFLASGRGGLKIMKIIPATIASSCTSLPTYTGGNNLNVSQNQNLQYKGSVTLHSSVIQGTLFYCGTMALTKDLDVKSGGTLTVQGSLVTGAPNKYLKVDGGGKLKIQGNLTIYGNLQLASNSTLEFVGTNNTVAIYGTVTKGTNVTITGTYTDVNGKL